MKKRASSFAYWLATSIFAFAWCTEAQEIAFYPNDPLGLPAYTLPGLLTAADGRKVTSAVEWTSLRRPEILELFRTHEYGRVPDGTVQTSTKIVNQDANALSGAATLKQIDITLARNGKSITVHVSLFTPNASKKPAPAFLFICNRSPDNIDPTRTKKSPFWPVEEIITRGYATAAFHYADVVPDAFDGFKTGAYTLFDDMPRKRDSWSAIAAWAWGASRVMDYLSTDPAIDANQVAVIGHSRGGKTALWCGAQDERFALTISNDSGCSGAGLARRRAKGQETVAKINKSFPHWFCDNYKLLNEKEDAMPFDQHMLVALMAPRAVYIASASLDQNADPRGEFLSAVNAAPAFQLCGKKGLPTSEMPAIGTAVSSDAIAYHIHAGKHDLTVFDWQRFMDFADKIFGRAR